MNTIRRALLPAWALLLAVLPAFAQDSSPVVTFSSAAAGQALPDGWEVMRINPRKKLTQYRLVDDGATKVLHAVSAQSASAVGQYIAIDLDKTPIVEWRWKIGRLIEGADMLTGATEDSPARLVFAFDGDVSKLPLADRASAAVAKNLSGKDLPYATLMYVWATNAPIDKVIRNPHTGQVRMMVVATGAAGVGKWHAYSRNLREDFKRAFGEYPGRMLSYGVLTDSDNTGESAEAWYGDIVFKPAKN